MKVAVALALVAACIAASYSNPVTRAVDWTAVAAKVGELEYIILRALEQMKDIALADNEQVGPIIAVKLDDAAEQIKRIFQQFREAIDDQSLTEYKVKELWGQVKAILAKIQQDLQGDLAQLSAGAASQIRDIFYSTYASAEQIAQEVYALLRQ